MNTNRQFIRFEALLLALVLLLTGLDSRLRADTGNCSGQTINLPFTDVAGNPFFCQIAAAFFSGLTNGTSATTYSPSANVPREQMTAFITRTVDQSLKRGSQRAALGQWWTPTSFGDLQTATVGNGPRLCKSDGLNIWVANQHSGSVSRVSRVTGDVTGTWTGATNPVDVLVAKGQVFIIGVAGNLYSLDPSSAPGPVSTVTTGLGINMESIAFDGSKIWVTENGANIPGIGSVSAISLNPVSVQTFTAGFGRPFGICYDGANIWVTDHGDNKLKKLNPDGSVALIVTLPNNSISPIFPAFDGTNIWVPTPDGHLYVVRAIGGLVGTVLATLTGNGLGSPHAAAFDGERILVTNGSLGGNLSLWRATDLSPLGFFAVDASFVPFGVCSDGINFWVTLTAGISTAGKLARF